MFRILLTLSTLLLAFPAFSALRLGDYSTGGTQFNMGAWSGTNDLRLSVDFCVASVEGNRQSTTPVPYRIKFRSLDSANEPFELFNSGWSLDGLPLQVRYTDLYSNNSETLAPNTFTSMDKTGALFNCPNGPNARLQFTIQAADLNAVDAGTYNSRFRIVVRGGIPERRRRSVVTVTVNIGSMVQISGLDDIAFGSYSGSGGLNATDAFCVYRNNAGTYQVTASGSGAGGAFSMQANSSNLPFELFWNDQAGGEQALTPNSALTNQQNVFTANTSCNNGGSNNASIRISASEASLSQAPAGLYRGVITFMISPE